MKKALITGGAGGLGLATAQYLVSRGWTVYAADFNNEGLEKIRDKNTVPIQVDVSSDESIERAVAEVKKTTDTLDGVVNFAGIMLMGSVIENNAETMRRILDINLLGMYRINKAFFDMIRKGRGRIVNISSEYGTLGAVPFNGFYTASKHAVEIYSDALRRELIFFDVPVIKIRPGAFKTNMVASTNDVFKKMVTDTVLYKQIMTKMSSMMESKTGMPKDPAMLAQKVYKALTDKKPKLAYSANLNISQKVLSALPERMQDIIFKSLLK